MSRDPKRNALENLAEGVVRKTPGEPPDAAGTGVSRRAFLEAAGFSVATVTATGCAPGPIDTAIPYLAQPEGLIPGRPDWYASTCGGCAAGCGTLVKTREGRPIKLEGNPDHPVSRGGLCAVGQASVLGVYDSRRLRAPEVGGEEVPWQEVDERVREALAEVAERGGRLRLLTDTVNGPTDLALIDALLAGVEDSAHVMYDAMSCSAILRAHEMSHGVRLLPRYRFDRAEVIASFGADFLGTWISPVEFAAAYRDGRSLEGSPPRLSRHVHFESRLSLTGANADHRVRADPHERSQALAWLVAELEGRAGSASQAGATPDDALDELTTELGELAERLWRSRGHSLVVSGSQSVEEQLLCNRINDLLGGYGRVLEIDHPSQQRRGSDSALEELIREIESGAVDLLVISGVNPVYDLPMGEALGQALDRLPMVVALSSHRDETTAHSEIVCPSSHALESWRDAEPIVGTLTLTQPVIRPVFQSRTQAECLAAWKRGRFVPGYELHREAWEQSVWPLATELSSTADFRSFWEQSVHDGFALIARPTTPVAAQDVPRAVRGAEAREGLTLELYPKISQLDGRHAHNAWLHELPDPITKACWDNYACLSPAAAAEREVETGDLVRVEVDGEALDLPAFVQQGQHDGVVAVAIGYGRHGTGRYSDVGPQWFEAKPTVDSEGTVGVRAGGLARLAGGVLSPVRTGVTVTRLGGRAHGGAGLALTQTTASLTPSGFRAPLDGSPRPLVQETTLGAYLDDPEAGTPVLHHFDSDLWPEHESKGHHWGLAIDLNACTGCSACVVACQVENNVPVVGRDEVQRSREMHWMRIDRYHDERGDTQFQPMLCQQCDNAPCETVCPVVATVHSSEGLNQQVYNRCVGTRYCANNCPYKVRRFNWFNYPHRDPFENLVLNPEVVVRTRGVMEKCTFCVQRIEDAKITAKAEGRELSDGELQTACQQSCPAKAIVFGDTNDPDSRISKLAASGRHFRVLEELNVKPSVGYLRRVRNRAAEPTDDGHGGGSDDSEVHHG